MDEELKITFDFNCIVEIENNGSLVRHLNKIIDYFKNKKIIISIPMIAASEKKQDGKYSSNVNEFLERLKNLNISDANLLKPIVYWGFTFYGHAIYPGKELADLEKKIHSVLFPKIEYKYNDFCKERNINIKDKPLNDKWLNVRCDTLALWCHIYYGNDVFISSDKNYFKKTKIKKLIELGAKNILKPNEALIYIEDSV